MATTARLDLRVWRNDDVYEFPLRVRGLDLTTTALAMQIRLGRDVPGSPLVDMVKVTNGNAEGLRVAGVTSDAGVPVTDLRIRLNKSTRQALPYAGEVGQDTPLEYALLIAGSTRLVGNVVLLAHAYGSDAAPANRPAGWPSASGGAPNLGATLTIVGNEIAELIVDGADLAIAAADRADAANIAAQLAAATATAAGRYFATRAAGEAGSSTNQLFSTDDGAGNVIYYRKTAGGSVEIGRALTPASLAAPGAAAGVGYGTLTVAQALDGFRASGGVSVLDFIPRSLWAAIKAGTDVTDHTQYFQRAAQEAASRVSIEDQFVSRVFVPNGGYRVSRVGIRGTVFVGESREGTVISASAAGGSGDFMFDAMYNRDGMTFNTYGNGWLENLSLDGRILQGALSGRSGVRTYGGGQALRQLDVRYCSIGIAVGLPIWATVTHCYVRYCNEGIYTFHNSPGDNGTSTTFVACWALDCASYGFHISQLYYSSFINCVAQECGVHNFFLDGNLNGNTACFSLQFIGCATEGAGTPFYFKRGRDITVINPRIIQPASNVNLISFDDTAGSIMDFSTPGSPGAGKVHVWTNNATPYSIALVNSNVTYESGSEGVFLRLGSGAPGTTQSGLSASSLYVGAKRVVAGRGVAISDIDVTGLTGAARTTADTVNAILARVRASTGHGLIEG